MRKLKWILVGLFTLVVALAVAGYAVLSNFDPAELKAMVQQQVKTATGRDLDIRGDIAMRISLTPSVVMNDVHLANAPWASGPDLASLQRLEVEVKLWPLLSGDVEIERLVLVQPTIALERSADGETNLPTLAADGAGNSSLTLHAVSLEQGTITFHDQGSGLSREVKLDSLTAQGDGPTAPLAFTAAGAADGTPFNLTGSFGNLAALLQGQPVAVQVDGTLADATLSLAGQAAPLAAQPAGAATLSLQGPDLGALSALAGGPLPAGPFKLAVGLEPTGQGINLRGLALSVGQSDLAGDLAIDLSGDRPAVTGTLASKRFALADLRSGVADGGGAAQPRSALIPDDALPFDLLLVADGRIDLSIDELVLNRTTATGLKTTVDVAAGKLTLDPLGFTYGGGAVSGRVEVDATQQPPQVVVALSGSGIDAAQVSAGELSGTMAMALDVRGSGDSAKAVAATLDGRTVLASEGGKLNNALLEAASTGLMQVFLPLLGSDKEAHVVCAVNRMDWKQGIGTSQGTALQTDSFTVVGNGTVNLRNDTLDFYLDTSTSDASLVSLAVPLRAQGSLAAPSITPDPTGTALGLAKAAGLVVFPPAGLAAIIGDKAKQKSGNPCVAAIEEVSSKGGPLQFFQDMGDAAKGALDDAGKAIDQGAQDTLKGLQNLLGN